jgi:preprotein translocase subunit SecG
MTKTKYIILFSILFILLSIGLEFIWTMSHEQAHRQFAIYNGCTDYEIHYFPKGSFLCTGRSYENMTEDSIRDEYMLDSLNEIITYNNGVIFQTILMCSFMICLAIFLTYKEK